MNGLRINTYGLMRQAARVERCHTQPLARQQTVGEHTFGVLALLDYVYPEATLTLWRAALYHDAVEPLTGDIPATTKWRYPNIKRAIDDLETGIEKIYGIDFKLTDHEKHVLKYCDLIDLAVFAIEEFERGDLNAIRICKRCLDKVEELSLYNISKEASDFYDYLIQHTHTRFADYKGVLFNHE